MPKQYVAMRDQFASQGMSYDQAQTKAAKIYNSKHKSNPVSNRPEKSKPPHRLKRIKSRRSPTGA